MKSYQAVLFRVEEPEQLSNGGRKWLITLENGSQLMTYTFKLARLLSEYVGSEFVFECEDPPFEGASPKVARLFNTAGELLWEPAPKKEENTWGPPKAAENRSQATPAPSPVPAPSPSKADVSYDRAMNARTAVINGMELAAAAIKAGLDFEDALEKGLDASLIIFNTINTLTERGVEPEVVTTLTPRPVETVNTQNWTG